MSKIEITIQEKAYNENINYPCVMRYTDGLLVLFTSPYKGICLRKGADSHNDYSFGRESNSWYMSKNNPVPWKGTIIMKID